MFNPQFFKIGDEWIGAEDYATEALCWAEQAGIAPGDIVMLGKGNIGYRSTIAGAHTYDTYIYTDGVLYDGTLATRSQLAYATALVITADNVFVTHLKLTNNNNYRYAFSPSGNNTYAKYCYIEDLSTSGNYGAVTLYSATSGAVYNCDIKITCSQAIRIGYDRSATVVSNTVFGATGTALTNTPNSANQTVTDNFFFNNSTDFGNKPANFSNNASQDLTGDETGYDETHCVDFAGGDYRVKLSSPLHALGIGAFFEAAAAGTEQTMATIATEQLTESQLVSISTINNVNAIITESLAQSQLSNISLENKTSVVITEQKTECSLQAIASVNNLTTVITEQLTQSTATTINDAQLIYAVQSQQITEAIIVNVTASGSQDINVVVSQQETQAQTVLASELQQLQAVIAEQITQAINTDSQQASLINAVTSEQISQAVTVSVDESSGIFVSVVQTEQLTQTISANIDVAAIANTVISQQLTQYSTQQISVDLTISAVIAEQLTQSELINVIEQNLATQLNIDIGQITLEILTPTYSIESLTPIYTIEHLH